MNKTKPDVTEKTSKSGKYMKNWKNMSHMNYEWGIQKKRKLKLITTKNIYISTWIMKKNIFVIFLFRTLCLIYH